MNDQHNGLSSFNRNDWSIEMNESRFLSSSIKLREPHLLETSEQILIEPTASKLPQDTILSQSQRTESSKGCLGCVTWPRTFAFILTLVLILAIAIVIPIVLTNTLATSGTTTSASATVITKTTTITTTITTPTASDTTTVTKTSTSTSTTTTSVCGVGCSRTPISSSSSRLAYYTFNSNLNDATGLYPASGLSSPTYTTGYSDLAISLDATSLERLITSPMNLYNKSFTVQLWFYLTRIATQDNAFFGQQSLSNVGKYCLFLMSRLGRLYMGFYNDDTIGSTVLQSNTWHHATFVYDNDKRQRSIYLNGILDGQSATGVGPYLGTSGSMSIGSANVDGNIGTPYFSGYIDQLIVSTHVKSACEILNEATLSAYFPFDGSYTDAGPNSLALTTSGASFISGYTNQGVYLSGSNSYIQVGGLTSLGRSNYSYSIAFWIYPIVKGVLVHISANSSGLGWCTPFIMFTASGSIITQVYDSSNTFTLNGPFISTNTWIHITQTYSPITGQRLYINGALYASSSASTIYRASESPDFLTFGNMLAGSTLCTNPSTIQTVFQGRLDELRIYSRELSSIDVCLLAQS